jgi:glucuronate isomerase
MTNDLMIPFITDDFILDNDYARQLYFDYVQALPIVDYHNHLPPDEVAEDKRYANLTEIWLKGDHYKWRAMRANGVPESLITGSASSDYAKFKAWAETVPYTMRNPLYHWTQMELKKPFGIDDLLNETSARRIYDDCTAQLQSRWSARTLLAEYDVRVICTTDDPTDDLRFHRQYAAENNALKMFPTFRPDALLPANGTAWRDRIDALATVAETPIYDLDSFLEALTRRIEAFHALGCRASDHGLEQMPPVAVRSKAMDVSFKQLLDDQTVDADLVASLQGFILLELCKQYQKRGWVQQFHLGALRNVNTRLYARMGPNVGGDSISDLPQGHRLARFMDALNQTGELAKTVLYNLNPADNESFAAMIGNFNDGTTPGKIQWGSGWWFLDQKDGMEAQMNTLSNIGLLSRFVGMVTDSRSFLSFSRHDYFRRILCNLIGRDIQNGLIPNDIVWLGQMAANISYHNTVNYFGWQNPSPTHPNGIH